MEGPAVRLIDVPGGDQQKIGPQQRWDGRGGRVARLQRAKRHQRACPYSTPQQTSNG